MEQEISLWKGSPSQWLNLANYLTALLITTGISMVSLLTLNPMFLIALVTPLFFMIWKFLVIRCYTFELTTERLRITRGVVNQHIDEIELYRVKDSVLFRSWWMRLTGLSSIALETSDGSLNKIVLPAIRHGFTMREALRKQVEIQRDKKRVREVDYEDALSIHPATTTTSSSILFP